VGQLKQNIQSDGDSINSMSFIHI